MPKERGTSRTRTRTCTEASLATGVVAALVVACSGGAITSGSSADQVTLRQQVEHKVSPPCTGGLVDCDESCVDLATSRKDCGACGNACSSGETCTAGRCSALCPGTEELCGSCIDPASNKKNCGGCGNECDVGEVCSAGVCGTSCAGAGVDCDGACIDPKTSHQHCGATEGCGLDAGTPGIACASAEACRRGVCGTTCAGADVICDGECVDPRTSKGFCGATNGCGTDGAGSPGVACAKDEVCTDAECGDTCSGGKVDCNGACVDPETSDVYCGATPGCGVGGGSQGVTCTDTQYCLDGACACPAGGVTCNGGCVDPTSASYCGATAGCGVDGVGSPGIVCSGGQECADAACACASGQVFCGGHCIDPTSTALYCDATPGCGVGGLGSAGVACASGFMCAGSACVCPLEELNCGGSCADSTRDANNCGGCGVICQAGDICTQGVCVVPPTCIRVYTSQLGSGLRNGGMPNLYEQPLEIQYVMVGGGGGGSGVSDVGPTSSNWTGGGGGGSSGIITTSMVAYADGGNGALNGPGEAGSVASGTFILAVSDSLSVEVGGGGGGGASLGGGGGGDGYYGGAGGDGGDNMSGIAGGGGDVGGAASPAERYPGSSGGFGNGGLGGSNELGAAGGGGGFPGGGGGGGGADSLSGKGGGLGGNGADGGVEGTSGCAALFSPGGLGASTWAGATTLPAAAGAGGVGPTTSSVCGTGGGGSAGLVIFTYVSPTAACLL